MIFIPGMQHFRSLSAALSFLQLRRKWILPLVFHERLMIHGVHLITWAGPAFIWVMLLNHVKVWPGLLGSWGTESWDMGHPVSYDHHTLGPLIGCCHHTWPLIGCWQLLRKGMGQTQTQGITRNTTNIVNRAVAPGDDTKPWWQCGARHRHHCR